MIDLTLFGFLLGHLLHRVIYWPYSDLLQTSELYTEIKFDKRIRANGVTHKCARTFSEMFSLQKCPPSSECAAIFLVLHAKRQKICDGMWKSFTWIYIFAQLWTGCSSRLLYWFVRIIPPRVFLQYRPLNPKVKEVMFGSVKRTLLAAEINPSTPFQKTWCQFDWFYVKIQALTSSAWMRACVCVCVSLCNRVHGDIYGEQKGREYAVW